MRTTGNVLSFLLVLVSSLMNLSRTNANFQRDVVRNRHNMRIPSELNNPDTNDRSLMQDILSAATLVRRVEEKDDNDNDDDDYFVDEMYSLSGYSLKYAKCQAIQRFSEEAIQNGEYSPMVKDDIVILRLCPTSQCSSSKQFGCHYNYAEYAIGVSDYVRIMVRYTVEKKKNLCNFCAGCNGGNNNGNNDGGRKLEGDDEGENDRDNEDENDRDNEEEGDNDRDEEENNGSQDGDENDEDGEGFDDDDYYKADDDGGDGGGGGDDNNDDEGGNADQGDDDGGYGYCNTYADDCADAYNWCNGQNDDDTGYLDYMDYLDYVDCVKVEGQDNYGDAAYWIKPRCNPYTGAILMSIFYDPYCSQYAGDEVNLREFSGIYFRSSMFEDYYAGTCIDCSESVRCVLTSSSELYWQPKESRRLHALLSLSLPPHPSPFSNVLWRERRRCDGVSLCPEQKRNISSHQNALDNFVARFPFIPTVLIFPLPSPSFLFYRTIHRTTTPTAKCATRCTFRAHNAQTT